ncbi:urease accessory protein UreD [Lentibacillus sp. Marseille-P4043]|uniref:urease accessory protein UreD n=1 Tax=Lentibacillus sp. Marseille-P4043 TaxID=2040293 RepID=UPI00131A5672|nr:urease accessory protein UreD [Lentibacillus sp. Marseille-P4043]
MSKIGNRNVLADLSHRFPMTEAEFEGDDGELMIYLLSGSPGLFNGDRLDIGCHLTDSAQLFLTNPSATELHPSLTESEGIQVQTFKLGKNSILEYLPEPLIPFQGSNYNGKTTIYMDEGSTAIVGDIFTAGRVGHEEIYEYQCFTSLFEVYWQGDLHVWDSFQLEPLTSLRGQEIMRHYTHVGTLWILSERITSEHLDYVQTTIIPNLPQFDCYGGASLLHQNGMVIRLLGYSSQVLQEIMKTCWDYFRKQLLNLQPLEVLK